MPLDTFEGWKMDAVVQEYTDHFWVVRKFCIEKKGKERKRERENRRVESAIIITHIPHFF